jgi:hypothetical protein
MLESTDAGPHDVVHRFMTLVHEAQRAAGGEPVDINAILRGFMATLTEADRRQLARIEQAMADQDARCPRTDGARSLSA